MIFGAALAVALSAQEPQELPPLCVTWKVNPAADSIMVAIHMPPCDLAPTPGTAVGGLMNLPVKWCELIGTGDTRTGNMSVRRVRCQNPPKRSDPQQD